MDVLLLPPSGAPSDVYCHPKGGFTGEFPNQSSPRGERKPKEREQFFFFFTFISYFTSSFWGKIQEK